MKNRIPSPLDLMKPGIRGIREFSQRLFRVNFVVTGVAVVLRNEEKILIVKQQPWLGGDWVHPGGGLKDAETHQAAAIRELVEETGISLEPSDLGEPFFMPLKGRKMVCTFFVNVTPEIKARIPGANWEDEIKVGTVEIQLAKWVHLNQVEKVLLEEDFRLLKCALVYGSIRDNAQTLLGDLHLFIHQAKLPNGASAAELAQEKFKEIATRALERADQFNLSDQPMAWLLEIAATVIREEQLKHDLDDTDNEAPTDGEVFDWFAELTLADLDSDEEVSLTFERLPMPDLHVLRLAIQHNLDEQELAQKLGLTTGAALVRLHEALDQLRNVRDQQMRGETVSEE